MTLAGWTRPDQLVPWWLAHSLAHPRRPASLHCRRGHRGARRSTGPMERRRALDGRGCSVHAWAGSVKIGGVHALHGSNSGSKQAHVDQWLSMSCHCVCILLLIVVYIVVIVCGLWMLRRYRMVGCHCVCILLLIGCVLGCIVVYCVTVYCDATSVQDGRMSLYRMVG